MNGSLARLLAFWVNNNGKVNERELVTLLLETVRDDIVQAQTKDGKEVADPHDVQDYLNKWKLSSGSVRLQAMLFGQAAQIQDGDEHTFPRL